MTVSAGTKQTTSGGAAAPSLGSVKGTLSNFGNVKEFGTTLQLVGDGIAKCTKKQRSFNQSIKITKRRLGSIKEVGAIKEFGKSLATSATQAKIFSGSFGVISKMGAQITGVNAVTAAQANLAKSLGVSAKGLETWEGIAKGAGLKAGSVGKLIQEMNGKFGKFKLPGGDKKFASSLKEIGLSVEELEKLSPEQRFKSISSALKDMGDADKAKALGKQIFGGDASQFIGHLRSASDSLDVMYQKQAKQSLISEEGRQGAVKFTSAIGSINSVVSSASAEFSGLIGGALEPYVKTLAPKIGELFKEHRGDIKKFGAMIGEALPKIGEFAFTLLGVLTSVGSAILKVVDYVGGFGTVAAVVGSIMTAKFALSGYKMAQTVWSIGKAVAPIVTTAFPALIAGIKTVGVAFMTNPICLAVGAIALAIGVVYVKWDSLKKYFVEGLNLLGRVFAYSPIGLIVRGIGVAIDTVVQKWDVLKKYFVAGLNILGRVFAYSPIGLIIRGIGAAIDAVVQKWDALKETFTGGVVGKLVASVFGGGESEEEQTQKGEKSNREITGAEAPVGKSVEKTLSQSSVEQKKVGDSVKASTAATPQSTSSVEVSKREDNASKAPVGKSAEKTLSAPSVEQRKVGDSVTASTKAKPLESAAAEVTTRKNSDAEAKQNSSSAAVSSSPKTLPANAESKQQVITNYVTINVAACEGQSSKEVADEVHDKFVTSSSGAMYDE